MKTRAAVLWETGSPWSVEEIELDAPKAGEVLVKMAASGMCHSDEHVATGDLPFALPMIGGHEGSGIVAEVGPGVSWVKPGDHVVMGFIAACGRCHDCATGHSNLCVMGAHLGAGWQISDQTHRHHARGQGLGLMCNIGSFAEHTVVNEANIIKLDDDMPLDKACLLGCGVLTGWGSAVNTGEVSPGDTVVVVGIGGIGANAVQGARLAGARHIIAVDPVEFKRESAMQFGATHSASSMEEAVGMVNEISWGRMANVVVMTMGVGSGDLMAQAAALAGKRGKIVVTNLHAATETNISLSMLDLVLFEKQVRGSLFGSCNTRSDIPKLAGLYRDGQLKLDELITQTYTLDQVNEGYQDMRDGKNIRGVILY
jgi:NDMA-dependent alcohol dehydrogenase